MEKSAILWISSLFSVNTSHSGTRGCYEIGWQSQRHCHDQSHLLERFDRDDLLFCKRRQSSSKERLEIYAHGVAAILDDFRSLTVFANGKRKQTKTMSQDKGQKNEVSLYTEAILTGKREVIPFEELCSTSRATFAVLESVQTGQPVSISRKLLLPGSISDNFPLFRKSQAEAAGEAASKQGAAGPARRSSLCCCEGKPRSTRLNSVERSLRHTCH